MSREYSHPVCRIQLLEALTTRSPHILNLHVAVLLQCEGLIPKELGALTEVHGLGGYFNQLCYYWSYFVGFPNTACTIFVPRVRWHLYVCVFTEAERDLC
ncbi:unnamed protein product [Ectocarpus sp. 12 AP-2014]